MKINYFGEELEIPSWAKWVATGIVGCVYAYENKPDMTKCGFESKDGLSKFIRFVDAEWSFYYWKLSLKELAKEEVK